MFTFILKVIFSQNNTTLCKRAKCNSGKQPTRISGPLHWVCSKSEPAFIFIEFKRHCFSMQQTFNTCYTAKSLWKPNHNIHVFLFQMLNH